MNPSKPLRKSAMHGMECAACGRPTVEMAVFAGGVVFEHSQFDPAGRPIRTKPCVLPFTPESRLR